MSALSHPVLSRTVECHSGHHFRAAVASLMGCRPTLEDAFAVTLTPTYGFFGVFDGHSGPRCANHLAKALPALIASLGPPIADEALDMALVELDHKFVTTCTAGAGGSTAAFFIATSSKEIDEYEVQVANVGDSRVVIGRPAGSGLPVLFTTKDHKPDDGPERDRIVLAGGRVVAGRVDGDLAMSRAFGDRDLKKNASKSLREQKVIAVPDISRVVCRAGDRAVVCSDGLLEGVSNEEALAYVHAREREGWPLGEIAAGLCETAVRRGSRDNVTCVVIAFDPAAPVAAPTTEFVPGPFTTPHDDAFQAAYRTAAGRSGFSLDQALRLRKEWATKRIAQLEAQFLPADNGTPDYAVWGADVLAGILKAEGMRVVGDVTAMAATCDEMGRERGQVLLPVELRALHAEVEAKPADPPPAPPKAPAMTVDAGAWDDTPSVVSLAPSKSKSGPVQEIPAEPLADADDWEDLA